MQTPSSRHDIVVIGGSAGALQPLLSLAAGLPENLAATICVAIHIPAGFPSTLPHLLNAASRWPALHPEDHEAVRPGVIYVAPPDRHLLVQKGHVMVSRGPRENRHRPAIDVLFRTAARAYGPRVVGVILSGQLDDGAAGLMAIKMRGGMAIVQDPREAICGEMPSRAIQYAGADYVVKVTEIPELLSKLAGKEMPIPAQTAEVGMATGNNEEASEANLEEIPPKEKRGDPSAFACPECHGVLWELEEGGLLRFRCRVGHAYTADALQLAMSDATEDAIWAAMRALEEKAALLRRLATRSAEWLRPQYSDEAAGFEKHAETLRKILVENQGLTNKEMQEGDAA